MIIRNSIPSLTIKIPKANNSFHTCFLSKSSEEETKLKTFFNFYETIDPDRPILPKPQTPYASEPTDAVVAQLLQNASGSHDFRKDRE